MQGSASTGLTKPDMALFCIERERERERGHSKVSRAAVAKSYAKTKASFLSRKAPRRVIEVDVEVDVARG